mmetsp:Transcript_17202/g.35048  ORF Transcript_17202/g.35048 Transcript_17202/m.35048 type:complete len:308 (-) Transcript_17202:25-948(-)
MINKIEGTNALIVPPRRNYLKCWGFALSRFQIVLFFAISASNIAMCDGRKRREPVHEAGVEDIYAWWCMFAETTRPNSVICQEWVHEHKLREPRQYIEGRESFHAIAETDEMYRAWCGNPSKARTTVNQCSHLNEEAPARAHSEELSRPSSSSASSSLTTSSHPHSSGSDSGLESKWAHLGASAVSSQAMTHCPAPPNSERAAAAAKDGTTGGSGEGTGRWQAVGKVKVRLVLVVGVEGAGHKLLASVLDKASDFVFQKGASPEIFLTASSSSSSPSSLPRGQRRGQRKGVEKARPLVSSRRFSCLW